MIKLNIPIQQSLDILIGDIYVNLNLSFQPRVPPIDTKSKLLLDQIQGRLNKLGYELAARISHELQRELETNEMDLSK